MQTFVCQIMFPGDQGEITHNGSITIQYIVQTYELVKSFVDKLKDKGWPVEAAYSDSFKCIATNQPVPRRDAMAQRLFTIEVRCDFKDPLPGEHDPIELMKKVVQQAARQVYSSSALVSERVRPEIVIYSHDWFKGHADIPLYDDDIARGDKAITEHENVLAPEADVTTAVHLLPPVTQPLTTSTVAESEPAGFSADFLASLK